MAKAKIEFTSKNESSKDFILKLDALMDEYNITPNDLSKIMDCNTQTIYDSFNGKNKPSWTATIKLMQHLYTIIPDFSADQLFKSENDTFIETDKPSYKNLAATNEKLQSDYDKLLKKYDTLKDKYSAIEVIYNTLTNPQKNTFLTLIQIPDYITLLRNLRHYSLRCREGEDCSKTCFFNQYKFQHLTNLLDVLCQQTIHKLRLNRIAKLRIKQQPHFNKTQRNYKKAQEAKLETYSHGKRISKRLKNYIDFVDNLPDERLPFSSEFMGKHFGNYLYGDLTRNIFNRYKNILVDPTAENPEWFKDDLTNEPQS